MFKSLQSTPEEKVWLHGSEHITMTSSFTHVDLTWSAQWTSHDTLERIQQTRRTIYAITSTELHGKNGASPAALTKIVETYVLPQLIHGLPPTHGYHLNE